MAAIIGRTQIQVKKTGSTTTVPNTPIARLMYYFDCISSCVEADGDYMIRRLRNYQGNYLSLSNEEEAKLLILCLALSPDKLIGTILFQAEDLDRGNEFFEVSAVSTKLVVAQSLLIGGQQQRVQKIMMFKKSWIERYYLDPLLSFERAQRALPSRSARPMPPNSSTRQLPIQSRPLPSQSVRPEPPNPPTRLVPAGQPSRQLPSQSTRQIPSQSVGSVKLTRPVPSQSTVGQRTEKTKCCAIL